MKFILTLLTCFFMSSCYADDYCSAASDKFNCDALAGCQSVFEDVETDLDSPIFAACIANNEPVIHDVIENGCDQKEKVVICHHNGNKSAQTIFITCEAVKAHKDHHDDYAGACTSF